MLVTPDKIRILQRKLYSKAKQDPGYRFYAFYDKVYRVDVLRHAYNLVRSNRGAPGIGGVNFEAIAHTYTGSCVTDGCEAYDRADF